jgi:hypothetical protein
MGHGGAIAATLPGRTIPIRPANKRCPPFGARSYADVAGGASACALPHWQWPSCSIAAAASGVNESALTYSGLTAAPPGALRIHPVLRGRMGNHLFQVAAAYALVRNYTATTGLPACLGVAHAAADALLLHRTHNRPPPQAGPTVKLLDIPDDLPTDALGWNPWSYVPPAAAAAAAAADNASVSELLIDGYAQSYHHFHAYRDEVRWLFSPPANVTAYLNSRYRDLHDSICYHVRAGDKLHNARFYAAESPYYAGALRVLLERHRSSDGDLTRLRHAVVAENATYARSMPFFAGLGGAAYFIDEAPAYSLWALTLCGRGIVAAASSFSWWGAYLRADLAVPVVIPRALLPERENVFPGGYFPPDATVLYSNGSVASPGRCDPSLTAFPPGVC